MKPSAGAARAALRIAVRVRRRRSAWPRLAPPTSASRARERAALRDVRVLQPASRPGGHRLRRPLYLWPGWPAWRTPERSRVASHLAKWWRARPRGSTATLVRATRAPRLAFARPSAAAAVALVPRAVWRRPDRDPAA